MFSRRRNRVTRTDINELNEDIVRIDRNINTLSARIDDRARLRALREVRGDIRSLVNKIDKNKDFIFEAADCNNPGPDVNPVCKRIRQPEGEEKREEEQVGGRKKMRKKRKTRRRKRKTKRKKRKRKRKTKRKRRRGGMNASTGSTESPPLPRPSTSQGSTGSRNVEEEEGRRAEEEVERARRIAQEERRREQQRIMEVIRQENARRMRRLRAAREARKAALDKEGKSRRGLGGGRKTKKKRRR